MVSTDDEKLRTALGRNLKQVAAVRGMRLLDLGAKVGFSSQQLSKVVSTCSDVRLSTLSKLCRGLNLSPNTLLSWPKDEVQLHTDKEVQIVLDGLKEMEQACDRVRDELRKFYASRPAVIRRTLDP